MKYSILLMSFLTFISSCQNSESKDEQNTVFSETIDQNKNLLNRMSHDDLLEFSWFTKPENYAILDGKIEVTPKANSDYFNDPATGKITGTAPLFHRKVEGDFVMTAKVKPNFQSVWNACALMVYQDSTHWGKLCFENSDATGPSVVTVVTKETSDDSNGPIIHDQESIWLRLARKNTIYAMYWSLDGEDFKMARLFALPETKIVKVGLAFQCPDGPAARHECSFLSLEKLTLEDLRRGK